MKPKLEKGQKLVAATHNPGKAREIAALLEGRFEVAAASELGLPELNLTLTPDAIEGMPESVDAGRYLLTVGGEGGLRCEEALHHRGDGELAVVGVGRHVHLVEALHRREVTEADRCREVPRHRSDRGDLEECEVAYQGSSQAPVEGEHLHEVVGRQGGAGEQLHVVAEGGLETQLFTFLHGSQAPFEQFFFDWRGGRLSAERAATSPAAEHYASPNFAPLQSLIEQHGPAPGANLDHPYFARQRPRTMLIEEVEALWAPIAEADDWGPLERALAEIEEFVRVAGYVRAQDIDSANRVSSQRIANARIAYSGRGPLNNANSAGWLTRFFTSPWMPF